MHKFLMVTASLVVCGCATTSAPEEEKVWARADCQRAAGNPALEAEFLRLRTMCTGRAQASAIAGTAVIPTGRGFGGAIASGIEKGITEVQIGNAMMLSCMAEEGYLMRTRSEFEAVCPPRPEPKAARKR